MSVASRFRIYCKLAGYAFVWRLGFGVDNGTLPSVCQKSNIFGPTFFFLGSGLPLVRHVVEV